MNISVVGYAVLAMLGVALWAYSRFRPHEVSPLGQLLERLMSRRRTRLAIIAAWWWLGWHFFTNVRLPDLGF